MDISEVLPYILSGGAVASIIAALRWGRQDAKDSVDMASSNIVTAMSLRKEAIEEVARVAAEMTALRVEIKDEAARLAAEMTALRSDLKVVRQENARLSALLRAAGVDPGEVTS